MTPLIRLTVAWLVGIALAQWLMPAPAVLAFLCVPIIGGLWLYRHDNRQRLWALLALLVVAGAGRYLIAQPIIDAGHVAFYNDGDPITLIGRIVDEPDIRDNYINLRIRAQSISFEEGEDQPVTGLVLVRGPRYPEYHYGDTLSIFGGLETPPIFDTFSYQDYLARQNIYSLVRRPRIRLIAEQQGFSLKAALFALKMQAHEAINRILPEPHAALLNGVLLGIESGIPRSLYDQFNATGSSHVIVISGSNISLVVGILLLAGQRLVGKRYATILAVMGVILYTLLVGADASVTRAAIMGLIYVGAIYLGRGNHVLTALFATALVMTLINPFTLWDIGFQLSFLATLGLIVLAPLLERGAEKLFDRAVSIGNLQSVFDLLNEALLVTIAAQIITTPIILYHFGRFSLVSLMTNLLIVPVQSLVMIFGGLATVAGMIFLPLGKLLGWLAWLPLAWTITIVRWTSGFSWAQIELPAFPWWLMALSYLTLGAAVWWLQQPVEKRRRSVQENQVSRSTTFMAGGLAILAVLIWSATRGLPDGKLHVAFLDIGQGDAILITTPRGRQILIDGGPSPAQLGQRLGEEMPFWDHSLDMIVNTHPDADHLGGLVEMLARYEVGTILVSDAASGSALYGEWLHQLEADHQSSIVAWQDMTLQLDEGIQAIVLNPGSASLAAEAPNDHSVVIKLVMGKISFLLTGDIEAEVERGLAASDLDLRATVLKSAHHGSKTSSTQQFLERVDPQIVVISVGVDNQFGHPHPEVLQRYVDYGATILRTDESGTVELITDGERIWAEAAR